MTKENSFTTEIEREMRLAKSVYRNKDFYVATKENSIGTEVVNELKKSCLDRVDKLKRKMLVAKKNNYVAIVSKGRSV